MSDRIRNILEERIISGVLQPGDRLLELELAREFNTSQTPVREAIEALNSQRLIESIPYRGTYVRGISSREMQEAYEVRGALEQLAAELAAPQLRGDVSQLTVIQKALLKAAAERDVIGYARENNNFHQTIVELSNNQVLLESWKNLGFESRVRVLLAQHADLELEDRAREHDPVIAALKEGDGPAAGAFLRHHAQQCSKRWQEKIAMSQVSGLQPNETTRRVPASVLS